MNSKKGQSAVNAIVLIFIVLGITVFVVAFKSFGASLLTSDTANLNTQSRDYVVNDLYSMNLNVSKYDEKDTTKPPYLLEDEAQSNKDYSLEFQFSKDKGESFWDIIFDIYEAPSILFKLFGIENLIPGWLESIINGLLWTLVTAGIYFLVRGINK